MTYTTNKAIKCAYRIYKMGHYDGVNIWDVYGRYSDAKDRAFWRCLDLMAKYHGHGGVILTHNTSMFTYAFIGSDPDTGEATFFYITPTYDYCCHVDTLENAE